MGPEAGRAVVVAMDVMSSESVDAGVSAAQSLLGPLRIVVNNSGISGQAAALEISEAQWDAVLDTNLKGAFLVARSAARGMVQAGCPGSIINIASILSMRVTRGLAAYAASGISGASPMRSCRWKPNSQSGKRSKARANSSPTCRGSSIPVLAAR